VSGREREHADGFALTAVCQSSGSPEEQRKEGSTHVDRAHFFRVGDCSKMQESMTSKSQICSPRSTNPEWEFSERNPKIYGEVSSDKAPLPSLTI